MKYKYDAETDILLIKIIDEKPDHGEMKENVVTHYNKRGKAVEIEILDASKTATEMLQSIVRKNRGVKRS